MKQRSSKPKKVISIQPWQLSQVSNRGPQWVTHVQNDSLFGVDGT
jgi:hypothetical protein